MQEIKRTVVMVEEIGIVPLSLEMRHAIREWGRRVPVRRKKSKWNEAIDRLRLGVLQWRG